MTEDKFENLMDEAVDCLVNDSPKDCIEIFLEINNMLRRLGSSHQAFEDVRQDVIQRAVKKSDSLFIKDKLIAAEKEHQKLGSGIIQIH